ncbi:conserved hypothetical protein [Hyella patelloides LEGE 07179]|uniref:DUF1400 domain-containing protein n=1 Tax=Hyella patelloides LEGE 07179 TaxID=945734 RepID=A0A563VME7_9CYAN|nr:alpha/beta hydrolase [Hyella patelloides]VEP12513.1 conserved hypothetical protein [Hyella patelloides LEGE 07179]
MKKNLGFYLLLMLVSGMFCLWRTPPIRAAEKISFRYSLLEFSLPVASLEAYAKTGEIDRYLRSYLKSASPQELIRLRELLNYQIDIGQTKVYRFFNSSIGKNILQYSGNFIQASPTQNGFYGLRSAFILAAGEPDGLSLLNILRHFPSKTIYINGEDSLNLAHTLIEAVTQTQKAIAAIQNQADLEIQSKPQVDFTQQPDIRKAGTFTWKQKTITFDDTQRNRSFNASLYRPQVSTSKSIPTIIVSPGLGADGSSFDYLGQHLASYGFAVIIVDHPGSDRLRVENFFKGINREIIEAEEFIARPGDISYMLDELQRRELTNPSPNNRLNLERVGMIGHSLGAYTALALAGAELNLEHLQQSCQEDTNAPDYLNFSLLFQCVAAELSTTENYQLFDPRIKAVFALNPMNSLVFGQQGLSKIQVPVTFVAGGEDVVTPALLEQFIPFTWLESPHKYLLSIDKGSHTYESINNFYSTGNINRSQNLSQKLSQNYLQAITLAFMKNYLVKNNDYQIFLNSGYAQFISHDSLKLNLVNSLNEDKFKIDE